MDVVSKVLELNGIEKLNPAQQSAIDKGLLSGSNMVIAAPTASGKTLIAEIAALDMLWKGRKVLYIVPLKALASEKYHEFKAKYEPLGYRVAISVGDLDASDAWLSSYDIIIGSTEKIDSLLRHGSPWIMDVGLVVADEIHLMDSPERGPTLEMVLTKIRKLSTPRILALSATISNYKEIAEWLDAEDVKSDYRPVKLYTGVVYDGQANFLPKRKFEVPGNGDISDIMLDTVQRGKQALAFINTRRGAESAAEKTSAIIAKKLTGKEAESLSELSEKTRKALEHPTKQCHKLADCIKGGAAFHHAGLAAKQRKLIEDEFRAGTIKVICSTPSLAMGLNLPAYRVLIRDLKRFSSFKGMDFLSVLEIQQMCIHGDEKVMLPRGKPIPIKEICDNIDYDAVISYNIKKKTFEECKILEKYARKAYVVIKLRTKSGNSIKSTPEHPFLVENNDQVVWKNASEIKKGDILCTMRSEPSTNIKLLDILPKDGIYAKGVGRLLAELKSKKRLKDGDLARKLDIPKKMIYHYKNDRKAMPLGAAMKVCNILGISPYSEINTIKTAYGQTMRIPEEINEDIMWLLGIVLSDGSMNKTVDKRTGAIYSKIRIFNKNPEIIRRAEGVFGRLGLGFSKSSRHGCFCLESGATMLAEIFNNSFCVPFGKKSKNIRITEKIFGFDTNLIAAFIAGVYDGDGSFQATKRKTGYSYRMLISTSSEAFANDLKRLLSKIFVDSKISSSKTKTTIIRGEPAAFSGLSYSVIFQSKRDIRNFFSLVKPIKKATVPEYSSYHNIDLHFNNRHPINREEVEFIEEQKFEKPIDVYNLKIEGNENFIASNFLVHNCGRAGRPKYDTEGEAILFPKSESEAKYAWENYVKGEPEKIYSKLGVEPVLRMHVLALIASGMCATRKDLMDFFFRTFYAHQYKDLSALESILDKVLAMLVDFGFIEESSTASKKMSKNPFVRASDIASGSTDILKPTLIGRRVSELYIDPLTADHIIRHMRRAKKVGFFPLLHMLCNSVETKPLASIRKNETEDIESLLASEENRLLMPVPNQWTWEYEEYLRSIKTAMVFNDWAEEFGEDSIMERRGVSPGELHARLERMDWMLYSAQELALLLGLKDLLNPIKKARLRVRHGIREELLPLIRLKGIGRARARKLWASNIRSISELRKVPQPALERILGEKTAADVREQLGNPKLEEEQETLE